MNHSLQSSNSAVPWLIFRSCKSLHLTCTHHINVLQRNLIFDSLEYFDVNKAGSERKSQKLMCTIFPFSLLKEMTWLIFFSNSSFSPFHCSLYLSERKINQVIEFYLPVFRSVTSGKFSCEIN